MPSRKTKVKKNIVRGIRDALTQTKTADDDAKGIPERGQKSDPPRVDPRPQQSEAWRRSLQRHFADDAGEHIDLRLARPDDDTGLSWALPKGLPDPGEKNLAVQTDDHDTDYFDFEGEIEDGYGSGEVKLERDDSVEVLESNRDKVRFNAYEGNKTKEYALVRTEMGKSDDQWLIINKTPNRDERDLPSSKPNYKEVDPENVSFDDDDQIMSPKIDGSHVLFDINPGEQVRVFSYRPAERETGLINHTYRVPRLINKRAPDDVPSMTLRGELWGQKNERNEPLPANRLGGILNSNVWKSRAKQNEEGEIIPSVFDVVEYDNQHVEDAPYDEKERILRTAVNRIDELDKPDEAKTQDDKESLYDEIRHGDHPETREGVVLWNRSSGEDPIKVKFKPQYDVRVENIFDARDGTKYEGSHAGGFEFSWPGENEKVVGRVGTGFSDELRQDMKENPSRYEGLIAKVEAIEQYADSDNPDKPGALRAPSFAGWHLDKNEELPPIKK